MRRYLLPIAALLASFLLSGPAALAQGTSYQPWQAPSQGGDVQQLLTQLRALIAKAEHDKAADPAFLKALKSLTDSYDNQWPNRVLFDDFSDGELNSNPAWNVSAGSWRVNTQGNMTGLQSRVPNQQGSTTSQNSSNSQNTLTGILGSLLQQQGGQTQQQPAQAGYAGIATTVAIPNAFAIHIEFASRQNPVRLDFGPYRGASNTSSGYYLTYMPAQANGLTLWSVIGGSGNKEIANSKGPVHLEDGALHAIDWKRDGNGKMKVALDVKPMMAVTDLSLRKGFDGFVIGNSGGACTIHSITINGGR